MRPLRYRGAVSDRPDPSSPAASFRPLFDVPRAFPMSSKLAVLWKGPGLPGGAFIVFLCAWLTGLVLVEHGGRTVLFSCVDVRGEVTRVVTHRIEGKRETRLEFRTTARASWDGRDIVAIGDLTRPVEVGRAVTVRIPQARPDLAIPYIGDAPRNRFGWLLPAALTAIGLALMIGQLVYNARDLRVLLWGRLVQAKIVKREALPVKDGVRHRLTFAFDVRGREARTMVVVAGDQYTRITDEKREWLVYDEQRPANALLLDMLPDRVRAEDGRLTPIPAARAVLRGMSFVLACSGLTFGLVASRLLG